MTALKTSKANSQPQVRVGQIWVEMDPRDERYIEILAVHPGAGTAEVRRVSADGTVWPKGRRLSAALRRFNGARSGYAIHRDS